MRSDYGLKSKVKGWETYRPFFAADLGWLTDFHPIGLIPVDTLSLSALMARDGRTQQHRVDRRDLESSDGLYKDQPGLR